MSVWQPPNDDFYAIVWEIVRQVPAGKVTTYGQVASMIPPFAETSPDAHQRLAPRWVGTAMRHVPDETVPWQRVINSQGKISLPDAAGIEQRQKLEAEGVSFSASGKVDLPTYGWEGPDDAWLATHDLLPPNQFLRKPRQNPLF